tara:strand:+ start:5578 stop:6126 length:549 start_codon:yes stop_codon:yes gene_type:complete
MSEENQESVPVTAEQQVDALNKVIEEMAEHMEELQAKVKEGEDWSTSSTATGKLAAALSKAQGEWAKGVMAGGDNPHFNSKFVELKDGVSIAAPVLAKNGLCVTQSTVPKTCNGQDRMFLETELSHTSGEWRKSYWPMSPERKGQQAMASEHTYACRRSYLGLLVIPAFKDDDAEASEGRGK